MQIIMTKDRRFLIKEIERCEKINLVKMAAKYAFHLVESKSSLMARIYGVFSLKLPQINKVYFIVMHSLDFCQDQKVVFRYDLKFSDVNRTHINTEQDLAFIQEYLVNKDSSYLELIN